MNRNESQCLHILIIFLYEMMRLIEKVYFGIIILEIDDSVSGGVSVCKNDASCVDQVNNYTCFCKEGYTGRNCSTSSGDWQQKSLIIIINNCFTLL